MFIITVTSLCLWLQPGRIYSRCYITCDYAIHISQTKCDAMYIDMRAMCIDMYIDNTKFVAYKCFSFNLTAIPTYIYKKPLIGALRGVKIEALKIRKIDYSSCFGVQNKFSTGVRNLFAAVRLFKIYYYYFTPIISRIK